MNNVKHAFTHRASEESRGGVMSILIRVGVPEKGGHLPFHAFTQSYPAMVSASAFWDTRVNRFMIPEASDIHELDYALDSAGFTAMKLWQTKGKQPGIGGVFPWSYQEYIELALTCGATWWSQPDLCCEPEIARNQAEIDYRIRATATFLEGSLRIVDAWSDQFGQLLARPVPIIQGWTADDYLRSLDLMMTVWSRWSITPPPLIGVGSVCRRHVKHPEHGLLAIMEAIDRNLPHGSKLHLFGIKGTALSALSGFASIASIDSMAYDFRARITARLAGVSNSVQHRSREMTHWMDAASSRITQPQRRIA